MKNPPLPRAESPTAAPASGGHQLRRGSRSSLLKPIVAGLAACALAAAAVALTPTEWQHRQVLNVTAPGLVQVDLTPASFDAAGPQQEDLRLVDPAGREVAYLLDQPPAPAARTIRPAAFDARLEADGTSLVITTGTTEPLASLALETPAPFFLRAAQVELSSDNLTWTSLDRGLPLFRQWGAEQLALPLGGHTAAFIRVTVADSRGAAGPFTGASLRLVASPAPAPVAVGARVIGRDEFAGETLLTVALDGRHLPLASFGIETAEPLFMRRVTVSIREVHGAVSGERIVGAGTLYRVALDGAPARAQLDLPLAFTPPTRELLVHIHNGDSPPLAVDGVRANRRPVTLMFRAPAAGSYVLLSGNPQATPPRYDLAAFSAEMHSAGATPVVPGEIESVPDYHPPQSLATAPLPDVPLTGAPLDARNWPVRRPIEITRPGVQELELDLAALALARADFADLRVLRDGNQIPYVLEQPALARSLVLTPVEAPDAKRPTVSVWRLDLPQRALPVQRLLLTSPSMLFQRDFRLLERLKNPDGIGYESVVASGVWSRTPEPGVPDKHSFDLPGRLQTGTLWIETNNGDNPAIGLGPVQVVYPVARLVFKVEATDGFVLASGNREAHAPQYDLSLVATKLLTASRNAARLSAAAPAAVATNPLAALNGGYLFWAALALVVVVLLVIVARLLPKPPAA